MTRLELVEKARKWMRACEATHCTETTTYELARGIVEWLECDQPCGIEPEDIAEVERMPDGELLIDVGVTGLLDTDEAHYAALAILDAVIKAKGETK